MRNGELMNYVAPAKPLYSKSRDNIMPKISNQLCNGHLRPETKRKQKQCDGNGPHIKPPHTIQTPLTNNQNWMRKA